MNKLVSYIITAIISICISIITLYISISMLTFNQNFYKYEFEKNNSYHYVKMEEHELHNVSNRIIQYLIGLTDELNIEVVVNGESRLFFSEKEILHMKDVKELFKVGNYIVIISFIIMMLSLFIVYKTKTKRNLGKALIIIPTSIIVFFLATAIYVVFNFSNVFTQFHKVLFTNELWLLNPFEDLLIVILPKVFFIDIFIGISIIYLILMIIIITIGIKLITQRTK